VGDANEMRGGWSRTGERLLEQTGCVQSPGQVLEAVVKLSVRRMQSCPTGSFYAFSETPVWDVSRLGRLLTVTSSPRPTSLALNFYTVSHAKHDT